MDLSPYITKLAKEFDVPVACLKAVIEVESSGSPFEAADGKTPRFLFERHKFFDNLPIGYRANAVKAGLAVHHWDRAHQYSDQATSGGRLALLARAIAFGDPEAAYKSCSWGVFQVMGSNYVACGYRSPVQMFDAFHDVEAQLRGGLNFMSHAGLLKYLRRNLNPDFGSFAHGYNGPAFRENKYDARLLAAYKRNL